MTAAGPQWVDGTQIHSFPPVDAPDARVLILGSMPGVASLRLQQYYGHPRNAFWPIVGAIAGFDPALPYAERIAALRRARIALWDVLAACVRPGSLDAAIDPTSVLPNDIGGWLARHRQVERILFNGATSEQMFQRHVLPTLAAGACPALHRLPSTSPAHAGRSLADKQAVWAEALRLA